MEILASSLLHIPRSLLFPAMLEKKTKSKVWEIKLQNVQKESKVTRIISQPLILQNRKERKRRMTDRMNA